MRKNPNKDKFFGLLELVGRWVALSSKAFDCSLTIMYLFASCTGPGASSDVVVLPRDRCLNATLAMMMLRFCDKLAKQELWAS